MIVKKKNTVNCFVCDKKRLSKNEIGLSKKLLGRDIEKFFCLDCLAAFLNVSTEILLEKIEEFKAQGCTLFK